MGLISNLLRKGGEEGEIAAVYVDKIAEFRRRIKLYKWLLIIALIIWTIQHIAVLPCTTTYRIVYWQEGKKHCVCSSDVYERIDDGTYTVASYRIGQETVVGVDRISMYTLWHKVNVVNLIRRISQ